MTPRWIQIAHHIPGRTRLRSPILRKDVPACERLANALAALPNVREVKLRPYTGSVLILHDEQVALPTLVDATCRELGCSKVLAIGEPEPLDDSEPTALATLARHVIKMVHEIDRDVRRKSDGSLDLGTLATLGFFGAGAAEVAATGKLPLPPWFNLAWWGYRTFMTTHRTDIVPEP